jgi:hypothetical protein
MGNEIFCQPADSMAIVRTLSPLKRNYIASIECDKLPDEIALGSSLISHRIPFAVVIHNVLTPRECQQWIFDAEHIGFIDSSLFIGEDERNVVLHWKGSRCTLVNETQTTLLWNRIKKFIPDNLLHEEQQMYPCGLNSTLWFLRYEEGNYFAAHMDGTVEKVGDPQKGLGFGFDSRSYLTFQLYLNDDFEGGSTRFLHRNGEDFFNVLPKTGSVLLFEHRMEHSGEEVKRGKKYIARSQVMFAAR